MLCVITIALLCQAAGAQASQFQWWPEWDTYVNLNPRTRVGFTASRKDDGLDPGSVQMGPSIEVSVKPLLRRKLRSNNEAENKYLSFQAGYRYILTVNGPTEHRVLLEMTPRFPLPWGLLLSDRHRTDLRMIAGQYSWRYRNRAMVQRNVEIKGLALVPFARGELFYDSLSSAWSQNSYSLGVTIPVRRRLDISPFFEDRNNSQSEPHQIYAAGVTLNLYFRSPATP